MHACGHDTHCNTHGNCRNFSFYKSELKGLWNLFFQPAEEGPPEGEEGGAKLMVKEGVLENPSRPFWIAH
jgi:amidohydrolase